MNTLIMHFARWLPQGFWERWDQDFDNFVRHNAPKIAVILIVAIIFVWLLRRVTRLLSHYPRQQLRTVASLLDSAGTAVIVFFALMEVLETVSVNIAPLLASAGVVGLAIGFGAQTLVKDVITGFFILVENQYDIGDIVRISGVKGTVEVMTLRRTVLRDADGSLHIIPNSQIAVVSNLTRDWTQISLHIAVAYNEPTDRVMSLLHDVARDIRNDPAFADALVADPEVPGIERVSGNEVDYLMLAKTRPADQYRVSRELRRRIKECFEKNNLQPARPTRVFVVDQDGGRLSDAGH